MEHPTLEKTHGEPCPEYVEALGGVGEEVAIAKPDGRTLLLGADVVAEMAIALFNKRVSVEIIMNLTTTTLD